MAKNSDEDAQSTQSSPLAGSVEDVLAFHRAVQEQSEEKILRFNMNPKIQSSVSVKGVNVFSENYKLVEILVQTPSTCIEILEDSSGKKYVRKSKRDSDEITKLHERGYDFLESADHPAFPKAVGFFSGTVDEQMVSTSLREHVPGKNLEEVVKAGGAVETETALKNILQIFDGLSYAHEKGVFLGDIKPSQFVREDGTGNIKIIDVDSVTSAQKKGTSGTTFGIHSDTWQHPDALTPFAGMHTELFGVGTTFYYLLTSARPEYCSNVKKQYTLTNQKWKVLEDKFHKMTGGPELIRTVKALLEPKSSMKFSSAKEAMEDITRVAQIFKEGYSFRDYGFKRKGRDTFAKVQDTLSDMGKHVPFYALGGVALGIVGGYAAYTVGTNNNLKMFASSPVYEKGEENESHPLPIQAAEHLFNFVNEIEKFRLNVSQEESDQPNDIAQLKKWKEFSDEAKKIADLFGQSKEEMTAKYDKPIQKIVDAIGVESKNKKSKAETAKCRHSILTAVSQLPEKSLFVPSTELLLGNIKDIHAADDDQKDDLGRLVIDTFSYVQGRRELISHISDGYAVVDVYRPTAQTEDVESTAKYFVFLYKDFVNVMGQEQSKFQDISETAKKYHDEIEAGKRTEEVDITHFQKAVMQEYVYLAGTQKIRNESVSHSNYVPLFVALFTVLVGTGVGLGVQSVKRSKNKEKSS